MKLYYQDEYAQLYLGNCFNVNTKQFRYDVLLTDPPYGINYRTNHRKSVHADDTSIDYDSGSLVVSKLKEFISASDRASFVFCRWDVFSVALPRPKSLIVWVKNNWTAGDLRQGFAKQWEAIAFYPDRSFRFANGKRRTDVMYYPRIAGKLQEHLMEKPVGLLKELILCTDRITSVFDPFCGSGSTLVAAKLLGVKSIGIEIKESYCEIAKKRLQKSYPISKDKEEE